MSEIKIFRLQFKMNDVLRVQKIEVPQALARSGACIVHFSPDGRWLAVITPDNQVKMYRVTESQDASKTLQLLPNFVELKRLPRESAKTKYQHGSLGSYDRSIKRVAFSDDSRVLVTGDLSGYLDTWVLESYEDLTQLDDADVDGLDSSASSDNEHADQEQHPTVILGQHWIRSPTATLVPKLAAAPLILSFRPPTRSPVLKLTNGTTAVHPTRQTPHPHSHDLPIGEDRLFVLTSEHQVYEFEVLSGRISNWSRRNPTSSLPEDFRKIRDRAMGLVWDISRVRERVWLYGSSWLWMFDLSKDFPRPEESPKEPQQQPKEDEVATSVNGKHKRKRKREAGHAQTVVGQAGKQDSGAGGKIPNGKLAVGVGCGFRRTDGPESDLTRWISLDREYSPGSEDDDDNPASGSALLELRRQACEAAQFGNGISKDALSSNGEGNTNGDTRVTKKQINSAVPYWGTHKYRAILGIVPLLGTRQDEDEDTEVDGNDDESARGVEVALVERPLWEMDLPARYYGDQEWDNQ